MQEVVLLPVFTAETSQEFFAIFLFNYVAFFNDETNKLYFSCNVQRQVSRSEDLGVTTQNGLNLQKFKIK